MNPEEHRMCREDHYIDLNDILLYQLHLTNKDIKKYRDK
jgi:hypothetical protein